MNSVLAMLDIDPRLSDQLPLLGLFSGCANAELLGSLCQSATLPEHLRKFTPTEWRATFDLLREQGLMECPTPSSATFNAETQTAFRQLLLQLPSPFVDCLEQAFIDSYARWSENRPRTEGVITTPPTDLLQPEEQNLLAALAITPKHARWLEAGEILRALERLFVGGGHWKEWQWVLQSLEEQIMPCPESPRQDQLWDLLATFRAAVPHDHRNIVAEEQHLLQLLEHFEKRDDKAGRVRALRQLAELACTKDHLVAQADYYRECLEQAAHLDNEALRCSLLKDLGHCLRNQQLPDQAEIHLQQGLDIAKGLPDRHPEQELLGLLDETARDQWKWKDAERYCRALLHLAEKTENRAAQADALERLGALAIKQGLPADAEFYYLTSREMWKALGKPEAEATTLTHLGDAALLRQAAEEAGKLFEESLRLHQSLNNPEGQARAHARLGSLALETQDLELAGEHFFRSQQLLGGVRDPRLEATILTGLARIAYCREAFASAQNFYQQTLAIHERLGSLADIADVLYNLGLVAERLKDLPRARKRHQRSLEFAARAADDHKQIQALLQLASIALQQGQLQEAQRRCLDCLPLAEHHNATTEFAEIHYRLGRIDVQLCRPEMARDHFRKALQAHPPGLHLEWRLKVLSHLAALPELDKNELANHFRETLVAAEKTGDEPTQLKILYRLTELEEAQQNWLEAEHWLRRCLALEQAAGSRSPQARILQKLGLILDQQGRPQEAVSLFLRSISLNGFPSGEHPHHPAVMLRLAASALEQDQLEDALVHFQHCLKISKDLGDASAVVQSCLGLGRIALRRADLDNARHWLGQAMAAIDDSGAANTKAEVLVELGHLERRTLNIRAATRHYQAALTIHETTGNEIAQASVWVSLGGLAEDNGDRDQALSCFERARALFQVLRDATNLYLVRTAIQRLDTPPHPG